jgi:predicted nucleic acid-binding protein
MRVLIDTSVWVSHFQHHDERLANLLLNGAVVCHPFVITEIACGTPPNRSFVLGLLAELQTTAVATHAEVLSLIEKRDWQGRGCGIVDLNLLASTLLSAGTHLWTFDKRLDALARGLGLAYSPTLQS